MYLHLVGQPVVEEVGGDEEESEDEDPSVGEVVRPQQRGLEGLPDLLRLCPGFPRAVGVLHVGDEEDVDGNEEGGHQGQGESKHCDGRAARSLVLRPEGGEVSQETQELGRKRERI